MAVEKVSTFKLGRHGRGRYLIGIDFEPTGDLRCMEVERKA